MMIAMANGAIPIPSEHLAAKLRACAVERWTSPSSSWRDDLAHPVSYHGTRTACASWVEAEVKRANILHCNCDMQIMSIRGQAPPKWYTTQFPVNRRGVVHSWGRSRSRVHLHFSASIP